jgi:branched-chain amino acid transport system substrate-binding protein
VTASAGTAGGSSAPSQPLTIGLSEPTAGAEAALAAYGYGMKAYFDAQNAQGGVGGHNVKIVIYNDNYNPSQTLANAVKAVQQDHVFAFTGIGIPQNSARTYLNQQKVPQVFIDTADISFSNPPSTYPWSRAWLMPIGAEGYVEARYELENADNPKLCTIALAGALATQLEAGVKKAVADTGKGSMGTSVSYSINQPNVNSQILQLRHSGCTALIANLTGAGASLAPGYLNTIGWHPALFLMNSNVSRVTMAAVGSDAFKGVYSALIQKDPDDPAYANDEGIEAYKDAIAKYAPGTKASNSNAFNGYMAGEALGYALTHMKGTTGQDLLDAIDNMHDVTIPNLLPGVTLDYGPGGRLLFNAQISQFDGSEWKAMGPVVSGKDVGLVGYPSAGSGN